MPVELFAENKFQVLEAKLQFTVKVVALNNLMGYEQVLALGSKARNEAGRLNDAGDAPGAETKEYSSPVRQERNVT